MSDGFFEVVRLSRREVIDYNRRIAHPAGLHMCRECQHVYERTEANFFKTSTARKDGTFILAPVCRDCEQTGHAARMAERYNSDAAYKQAVLDRNQRYWDSLSPAAKLAHSRKRKQRQLARRLAQEGQA